MTKNKKWQTAIRESIAASAVAARAHFAREVANAATKLAQRDRAAGNTKRAEEREREADRNRFLHKALVALYNANVEQQPGSIDLRVYDESKQAVGVVLNRPGRVEIQPYASGKLLVYVYDGTSTDEQNEPIGCFDGEEPGNAGWSK